MNRGLNTCVNILSVTVPFSCFPLAVVFPELLPWIIALWCSPNCFPGSFSYVQDHSVLYSTECPGPRCSRYCNVIGQVYLPVRSSFSSRGASSVLLRLLCHRKSLPAWHEVSLVDRLCLSHVFPLRPWCSPNCYPGSLPGGVPRTVTLDHFHMSRTTVFLHMSRTTVFSVL